jgi:hypothetical protein
VTAPVLTVRVDWDNNADFTGTRYWPLLALSSTYDDITGDVMDVTWGRGGTADFGAASPGTAAITVDNSSGTYSPDNSSSVLFGKLLPGRPVWITATYSAVTYGIFAGFIRRIVPLPATKTAQIFCEDALGRYQRAQVSVEPSESRSFKGFRTAILDAIGEAAGRRDLANEDDVVPFSAADSDSALSVLEDLNHATATRHFIKPGTVAATWYQYTTRNRHYKLDVAADSTVVGTDPAAMAGYEVTDEPINNYQRVSATPTVAADEASTIWEAPVLPVNLKSNVRYIIFASRWRRSFNPSGAITEPGISRTSTAETVFVEFDNYVLDAALVYTATGSPTVTFTASGKRAKIDIQAGGLDASITSMVITGRLVQPANPSQVVAEDTTSQTAHGRYAGSDIATELVFPSLAQGLADHLVWRFKDPRKRPAIEIRNKFPLMLQRELFDTISFSLTALGISSRRFEIVGISGSAAPGGEWSTTWQLQETPEQPPLTTLFKLDTSTLDGTHVLGR